MRMIRNANFDTVLAGLRARMRAEDGATVIIALGVLAVSSLLVAGSFAAVQSDAPLAQRDLEAKRAYYSARSGVNAFLYELNRDPNYWQTCPKQLTKKSIGGFSPGKYTFEPVPANGASACSPSPPTSGDPISTLIDFTTGTFQYRFVGYAGNPEVKRGLIATFRKDTPLDYLWYTIYETLDPNTYDNPADFYDCGWNRTPRPDDCVDIVWGASDDLNGPAYTQDQYMISGNPRFGRINTNDKIESAATTTDPNNLNRICAFDDCQSADFKGTKVPNAPIISPPPDNDELLADAQRYGKVYTGVTFINLTGTTATITKCPTLPCTTETINIGRVLPNVPIIYVNNGTGCSYSYSPYNPTYPTSGPCGTAIVKSTPNYGRSLTIAADSDVIVEGPIVKSNVAPAPVLGLVANNFVRVKHPLNNRPQPPVRNDCGSATNGAGSLVEPQSRIDAAILAIKHSFIVDNWDCGAVMEELTIKGAIAQLYRGTVGRGVSSPGGSGYKKDYNYDDRLAVAQPPYLFDIAASSWNITRETACVPGGTASSTTCGTPTSLP